MDSPPPITPKGFVAAMSSALLLHPTPPQAAESLSSPAPHGSLSHPQAALPSWPTAALVAALNALPQPVGSDGNDGNEAIALYREDLARASRFYHELACRMVRPHLPTARDVPRGKGELPPHNVVLVGAAGGMGAAVAQYAAARGATLTLIDLPDAQGNPSQALADLAHQCRAMAGEENVQVLPLAATDDAAMHAAMQKASEFGGGTIDMLLHAAGIFGDKRAFEITAAHLDLRLNVNARSTLVSVNAALPYLCRSKNPSYLFVSSMAATEFVGNQAEYCFTKHHQSIAMDLLGHLLSHHLLIKVTELRFGHVYTPMCHGRMLDKDKMIQVEDVAELAWAIAKAQTQMRFKCVEVTPTERLEGEVVCPEKELAALQA